MDFSDLINYHYMMWKITNDPNDPVDYQNLYLTYDIIKFDGIKGLSDICIMRNLIQFHKTVDSPGDKTIFQWTFTFDESVTWRGDSATIFYIQMRIAATQAAGEKVTVDFGYYLSGGSVYWSNDHSFDLDQIYCISFRWYEGNPPSTGDLNFSSSFEKYDKTSGKFNTSTALMASYNMENSSDDLNFSSVLLKVRVGQPQEWIATLYEPELFRYNGEGTDMNYPFLANTMAEREIAYTTYTHTSWKLYLFPPKDILDGSLYDITDVLNSYIEILETDVATLQADVTSLETTVNNLESELATSGGTIYDWIENVFTTLSSGGTIYGWMNTVNTTLITGGVLYAWLDDLQTTLKSGGTIYGWISNIITTLQTGGTIFDRIEKVFTVFNLDTTKLTRLKDALDAPLEAVKTHIYRFIYNVINDWRQGT